MNFAVTLLLFILGVILVVKGGDLFVDAAGWIARAFGIPPFIIGATIVSLATTMPEMLVSVMAAVDGMVDIAIGNAVGSVTANTALILALGILFMPTAVSRQDYLLPCSILIASAATLWLSTLRGSLNLWGSLTLLILCTLFMAGNLQSAKRTAPGKEGIPPTAHKKQLVKKGLVFFLGASAIVVGSELLVDSGSAIAAALGVPERIIAVTLIAVGTSLPELVTTLAAIAKKESGLSVGNIIGANIIDLTLILPMCNLVSGKQLPISAMVQQLDLPMCFGVILLAMLPMLLRQRTYRLQGLAMLGAYIIYLSIVL